jgi:hypothetical protein
LVLDMCLWLIRGLPLFRVGVDLPDFISFSNFFSVFAFSFDLPLLTLSF